MNVPYDRLIFIVNRLLLFRSLRRIATSAYWASCLSLHKARFLRVHTLCCSLPFPIKIVADTVLLQELTLAFKRLVSLKPLILRIFESRVKSQSRSFKASMHSLITYLILILVESWLHLVHHCVESSDLLLQRQIFRTKQLFTLY